VLIWLALSTLENCSPSLFQTFGPAQVQEAPALHGESSQLGLELKPEWAHSDLTLGISVQGNSSSRKEQTKPEVPRCSTYLD
jgi:hypothetical protein